MQEHKYWRTACLVVLLWYTGHAAKGNDSLLMHRLVRRIAAQQVVENGDFAAGLFPAYREYSPRRGIFKNDDNVFYTGLVVFTLQQIKPFLAVEDQQLCDTIAARARPAYRKYRNQKGRDTYSFWQTDTPIVFPHGGWLNLMNAINTLPDDMDDTAILLLAMDAPDSTVRRVHALMQQYRNLPGKRVKNTLSPYRNIPAYSTWFGKKMPIDFDVCVLSNLLYLVQQYQLPFRQGDSASVQLLRQVIARRHHITRAEEVAPHYRRPAIILYHLSRLMQLRPLPALDSCRQQLIGDAKQQYRQSHNFMDRILLSIALLRWGEAPPAGQWNIDTNLDTFVENNDFVFFIANMASILPNPFKQWIGQSGIGRFYYYCPAYNNALLLEYLSWKKRRELHG